MTTLHEKSPCCRGAVYRYGRRRRQCSICHRTWSAWKKKRGRRRLRIHTASAQAFIEHRRAPIRKQAGTRNKNQYRLARSRSYAAKHLSWPAIPEGGDVIAVADALVKHLEGRWHTWYFILVRPIDGTDAVILPPHYRSGTEVSGGWREAFDAVDQTLQSRIKALVCDGHRGLVAEAKWKEWRLQRCHFHLIARLQSRRSKWRTSRHYEEGKHIYELAKRVLTEQNIQIIQTALNELEEISWSNSSSDIRKVLSGLVRYYEDYRTYLAHPNLRLPVTNNTAESLIGLIEEMGRRGRGFRTVQALNEWIMALVKTRKTIQCRPKNQQN